MESDPQAQAIYKLYKYQLGGNFPVFKGSRYGQSGEGFGDVFRSILKYVIPVVSEGATSFLGSLFRGRESGATWKDALKSSIKPTIMSTVDAGTTQLQQAMSKGSGRKRRSTQDVYKGKRAKLSFSKTPTKIPRYNF